VEVPITLEHGHSELSVREAFFSPSQMSPFFWEILLAGTTSTGCPKIHTGPICPPPTSVFLTSSLLTRWRAFCVGIKIVYASQMTFDKSLQRMVVFPGQLPSPTKPSFPHHAYFWPLACFELDVVSPSNDQLVPPLLNIPSLVFTYINDKLIPF